MVPHPTARPAFHGEDPRQVGEIIGAGAGILIAHAEAKLPLAAQRKVAILAASTDGQLTLKPYHHG